MGLPWMAEHLNSIWNPLIISHLTKSEIEISDPLSRLLCSLNGQFGGSWAAHADDDDVLVLSYHFNVGREDI